MSEDKAGGNFARSKRNKCVNICVDAHASVKEGVN